MCGICGILRSDQDPVNRSLLEEMNQALVHRGPDGEGFYLAPGVGLAMRRLAIIDLHTGDQPIPNEDNTVWIVFNGEIYNFPYLRNQLEDLGHHFGTKTDTECILHLYEEYGHECVQYLRGMFAYALWDTHQRKLFVARDRFGQKPFYYTIQNGVFYFSSELPSLLKGLPSRPSIHLPAIDLYLSLQYIPDPWTPYEGIYKLPAAHGLEWDGYTGEISVKQYWQVKYEPKFSIPEIKLVSELREKLSEAVRIRLLSDVPLGAHLSGGIDSSIVVALMAEAMPEPVKTFSVGFEESNFSELKYARSVAQRYATDHHEFILSFGDIPKTLEKLAQHFGEPFADPSALPLYHLSQLTREHVTVVLNGDGGDEAFAGYQRYWLDPWANRYSKLPKWLTQKLIPSVLMAFPDRSDKPIGQDILNGLQRLKQVASVDQRASILRWGSYFSPAMKTQLWLESCRNAFAATSAERFLAETFLGAPAELFLDRTLYTDIQHYLTGDLLVKADRMTMAASLEGRSPFLDHELASWAARLPGNFRVRGRTGKYLLRKAFSDKLPPEVLSHSKQGFGIPVSTWFRSPLARWAQDIVLGRNSPLDAWFDLSTMKDYLNAHTSGREDHGKRIFSLVMLSLWMQSMG
jgi:asparagine synthase (glutamine-hydrolysing)